jgi:hypothetical protein
MESSENIVINVLCPVCIIIYMEKIGKFSEFSGIVEFTIVRKTVNAKKTVTAYPDFSPPSLGKINTKMSKTASSTIGRNIVDK